MKCFLCYEHQTTSREKITNRIKWIAYCFVSSRLSTKNPKNIDPLGDMIKKYAPLPHVYYHTDHLNTENLTGLKQQLGIFTLNLRKVEESNHQNKIEFIQSTINGNTYLKVTVKQRNYEISWS